MICRNCSFILQGSEKFCPNCGTDCSSKQKTEKTEEVQPPSPPSIFFSSPAQQNLRSDTESRIFAEEEEEREEVSKPKKSRAKAVLAALLTAVILIVGGFTAIEYFNLAPAIVNYLEAGATTKESQPDKAINSDKAEEEYPSDKGIISPDINYRPTVCYVVSDSSLPLRKGPDEAYAPVVYLPSGSQVQALGASATYESWVYAFFPAEEKYGWISASFLSDAELPEAETTADTQIIPSEEAE